MVLIYFSHVEATVLDPMARRNHFRQQASLPLLSIAGENEVDQRFAAFCSAFHDRVQTGSSDRSSIGTYPSKDGGVHLRREFQWRDPAL